MSNISTIDPVYNNNKVSEFSQCGITTNELMNQTELCKAKKSYYVKNDHKISMKSAVTSDSKGKKTIRRFSKSKINIHYFIILLLPIWFMT